MTCDAYRDVVMMSVDPADVSLPPAARAHASACDGCRAWASRYRAAVRGPVAADAPDDAGVVGQSVLAVTTHGRCDVAAARLASAPELDPGHPDLLLAEAHAEHCPGCRALAARLRWQRGALETLAELEPDAAFLSDVLARTSRRPTGAAWWSRLSTWGSRVVWRPRFAWEAAYVCTLCWLLIAGNPVDALNWTTARVGAVARAAAARPVESGAGREDLAARARAQLHGVATRLDRERREATAAVRHLSARGQSELTAWVESVFGDALSWVEQLWASAYAMVASFVASPEAPAARVDSGAGTTEPPRGAVR